METIDRDELKNMMDQKRDFVLIEALGPKDFKEEHLPGAINIPVGDKNFEEKVKEAVPEKDKPIVVYCKDPECPASPEAAKKMDEMGYKAVFDYEGGKEDWREAGLGTVH